LIMAHNVDHKLFIGQVPKTMLEDELRTLFIPFGNVVDSIVIRDRDTKAHKGCAFVTFSTREEAEACINGLHTKMTLPGMSNSIQVKYAGDPPKIGGVPTVSNGGSHKLFIGMIPKTYTENEVRPLFEPFGEIKDLTVLRGPDGVSKGCAFLLYKEVPSAVTAITTLNGKIKLEGAPASLAVSFAQSNTKGGNQQGQQMPSTLLGSSLFGQNLFDPYQNLTNAASSLGAYGAQYMLPNGYSAYTGYPGTSAVTPQQGGAATNSPMGSNKEGPPGANLFIYHIPTDYTDASLMAMYSQFGNVISCKIITEKDTGQSKGFGFVSYDSPDSAQMAILSTNGMQLQGGKRLKVDVKQTRGATATRPY